MNGTRWVFGISLLGGVFWGLGIVLELALGKEPHLLLVVLATLFLTGLSCLMLFRMFPRFLRPNADMPKAIWPYYLFSALIAYVVLAVFFGGATYLFIFLKGDISHPEAKLAIALVALWFPLWWFVPSGLALGWYLHQR